MKVLLLGGGGREHALAWKMAESPELEKLYVAPGNAGTAEIAENVNIKVSDFQGIANFVAREGIHMGGCRTGRSVGRGDSGGLGSRYPIERLIDYRPGKAGAILEGSKDFAKEFMFKYQIPTAAYMTVTPDRIEEGSVF